MAGGNDNTRRLRLSTPKPGLFSPTNTRNIQEGGDSNSVYLNRGDSSVEANTALGSTASFKYDVPGDGIKSTQQLNVDWSKFENHTFFNSAQVKTNIAFDKIINEYPFDGTKSEQEIFFDKLTGFEKWVYDEFPKNKGYLYFASGSSAGTYVTVKDLAGAQYPTLSRLQTGQTILDPGLNSMTLEAWVYPFTPESAGTESSAIVSKISGSTGYAMILEKTGSSATVSMMVVSGGLEDKVSLNVPQNEWTHVHFSWDRTPGIHTIYGFRNNKLFASSSMPIEFKAMNIGGTDLYVGRGDALGTFTPTNTLSASIDELRIWHRVRSSSERNEYLRKPVFADNDLKLYFKFNEPSGSNSNLVLDHSSNSVHGRLNTGGLLLGAREVATGSISGETPMTNEVAFDSPVLFPEHPDSVELRSELLLSASNFDEENPNMISRLVPRHYFLEGQAKDSLETEEGDITTDLEGTEPREATLGSTQVLLSLLYTWAKFFDEMKLYIQAFSSLKTLDYQDADTIPCDFLSVFARNEGIDLPPLFAGSSITQYVEGENLQGNVSRDILSLQSIQNQIWKRILINLQDVMKSKGTIHSIKAFIRSVGINPDNNFRIREYGGPTNKPLTFNREKRFEVSTMLDFVSGGLVTSPELSASSKTEPGWPYDGAGSNYLLTSGSFTLEGIYKFNNPERGFFRTSQSLMRIDNNSFLLLNVVATSGSTDADKKIKLWTRADTTLSKSAMELEITGVDIFDGKQWYVSCGRVRSDDPSNPNTSPSGSYFLRVARHNFGEIVESYSSSSFYQELMTGSAGTHLWANNNLAPRFMIGSSSITPAAFPLYLNGNDVPADYSYSDFQGKVTQIRFWSKYLTNEEWPEHVVNYRSVGVRDPRANFNFTTTQTGSWNRLRIDASTDQITSSTDAAGSITLTDFTQNAFELSGSTFPATSSVIVPEQFWFSFISPKIDEGVTENKVRVRGYQDSDKAFATPWSDLAPIYQVDPRETPTDSAKLSIDFSIVDSLDQDIMTIFGSLDELNNILGDPELRFASSYKELDVIREIYFNKLEGKINLKGFFEFYKWFDTNIGSFVEQLVPRKTRFLGTNFVIESHFLERNKVQYQFEDIYLGEDIRSGLKDTILLRLITGKFSRF